MNKLQEKLSYQIRLNYFNNMDFTDYPTSKKSKDHDDESKVQQEMFYSMSNDYQLNESAMEQFTNLTNFINSNANHSFPVLDLTQEQKQMYLQGTRKQKQNNVKVNKKQESSQKQVGGQKGRNSSSSEQFQYKQPSPPSPNKVSLLQSSLKLSKPIISDLKNTEQAVQLKAPQKPIQAIKVFDNSLHKTQLSDQFAILPSLSLTVTQKSQSKQSNQSQSQESKNLAKMKIAEHIAKISSSDANVKMFRIQKPDDVFEQLEKQKQKQAQKQKEKKKQVEKIKNKVQQNIANAKYLINQVKSQNVKKATLILSSPIKKDQKSFVLGQIPNILKQQSFSWKSLIRLPQFSNEQSQPLSQNLYNRHEFTLTKTHIKLQAAFQVDFSSIYKIKIIYTEYNRPQLKITYEDENLQKGVKKNKQKDDNDRDKDKVIYFCDSYEVIYAIFAWVVVGKLISMGKKIKGSQVSESTGIKKMLVSFDYSLQGIIYKKSQFLKNWQKRYIKISNFCLKSYRISQSSPTKSQPQSQGTQPQTYKISTQCTFELEQIKQVWTRFEFLQNQYIVIKMFKKNKLEKYEIAIPIVNFCQVYQENDRKKYEPNWLVALVGILKGEI